MTRARCCRGPLLVATLGAAVLFACDGEPTAPGAQTSYEIVLENVPAPLQHDVRLEAWVYTASDTLSVGTITVSAPALRFTMPVSDAEGVLVTAERIDDTDAAPSRSVLLHGAFEGARAQLTILGAVTDGRALEVAPGAHSLFTTSNNVALGYPSFENAGLWLFSVAPSRNQHGTREVKLTPLRSGWVYEGWIVRQGASPLWISYGKFHPDEMRLLTSRDDSGIGPFAGDEDFRNAGVEDVPGEEWTTPSIANQLGIMMPGGLALPLALDAVDGDGNALWHHAITIEPAFDEVEDPLEGEPFLIRPYENPIGAGGPGEPRIIDLVRAPPTALVRPAEEENA